jgi:hypothetical protein
MVTSRECAERKDTEEKWKPGAGMTGPSGTCGIDKGVVERSEKLSGAASPGTRATGQKGISPLKKGERKT